MDLIVESLGLMVLSLIGLAVFVGLIFMTRGWILIIPGIIVASLALYLVSQVGYGVVRLWYSPEYWLLAICLATIVGVIAFLIRLGQKQPGTAITIGVGLVVAAALGVGIYMGIVESMPPSGGVR